MTAERDYTEDTLFDGRIRCRQHSTGYRFSVDAVLLGNFIKPKPGDRILDLGCGAGVLGIAAAKLWHESVIATDIDPIAITTTRANAKMNQVAPFIRTGIADGTDHSLIRAGAPFDLILANILILPDGEWAEIRP